MDNELKELDEFHKEVVSEQEVKDTTVTFNRFKDFLLRLFDITVRRVMATLQKAELKVKGKVEVTFPTLQKTSDEKAHEQLKALQTQYTELVKGLQTMSKAILDIKPPIIPEVKFPNVQGVKITNWEKL